MATPDVNLLLQSGGSWLPCLQLCLVVPFGVCLLSHREPVWGQITLPCCMFLLVRSRETGEPVGCRTGGAAWPGAAAFVLVNLHPPPYAWSSCGRCHLPLLWCGLPDLATLTYCVPAKDASSQWAGRRASPHSFWNFSGRASLGQDSVC